MDAFTQQSLFQISNISLASPNRLTKQNQTVKSETLDIINLKDCCQAKTGQLVEGGSFYPFFSHIAPDDEASPLSEFFVVALDFFVGADFFVVVIFVKLRPQP